MVKGNSASVIIFQQRDKKVGVISNTEHSWSHALSASKHDQYLLTSSVLQQNNPLTPAFLAGTLLFKCLPKYPT